MHQVIEEWKPVVGFENNYEVSTFGNIRRQKDGCLLKAQKHPGGYRCVSLCNAGVIRKWYIHRIVAFTFMGLPPRNHEVNHIDGNKANNKLSNLEYVTRKENQRHTSQMGLSAHGSRNGNAKLSEQDVREIRKRLGRQSFASIGRDFDVSGSTIEDIFHGRKWAYLVC